MAGSGGGRKGGSMPIHADDAERMYLQSKRRRLTETLHRIDNELKDVLNRGYTSLRTRLSPSLSSHPNHDIWEDVCKYYYDLGWAVKSEGHYMIVSPDPKRKRKPVPTLEVTPSGSFGYLKDFAHTYQTSSLMPESKALALAEQFQNNLNAQLGPPQLQYKEVKLTTETNQRPSFWKPFVDLVLSFWSWFKEVMK